MLLDSLDMLGVSILAQTSLIGLRQHAEELLSVSLWVGKISL
jgi:hypothetical protein